MCLTIKFYLEPNRAMLLGNESPPEGVNVEPWGAGNSWYNEGITDGCKCFV